MQSSSHEYFLRKILGIAFTKSENEEKWGVERMNAIQNGGGEMYKDGRCIVRLEKNQSRQEQEDRGK